MNEWLGLENTQTFLVPLVVYVHPVLQFWAGLHRARRTGQLEVDGVYPALLCQAGVLGQGGKQLFDHRAGVVDPGLHPQGQRAAVGRRAAALAAVVGGGGLPYGRAAVSGGAQGVAADAVLPGREATAGPGHGRAGRFAHRAVLAAARSVRADQGRRQLVGVGGKVDVDGCRCNDACTGVGYSDV